MINIDEAIRTLKDNQIKDNQIKYKLIYGKSDFYYTMLTFATQSIAEKAMTLLGLGEEGITLGTNGKWGFKYF